MKLVEEILSSTMKTLRYRYPAISQIVDNQISGKNTECLTTPLHRSIYNIHVMLCCEVRTYTSFSHFVDIFDDRDVKE